ncbi:hypothetical protein [Sphingobacterium sp.]|uniref:hypothetical protein n=1 Tax=Sphingobacterium sp. TaxID=341027 RepID=UPI0031DD08BE
MGTLKYIGLGLILLFIGLFAACKQDVGNSLDLNAAVDLMSFKVGAAVGTIA